MAYDRLVLINAQGLDIFQARTQSVVSGGAFVRAASGALPNALSSGASNAGGYKENTVQVDVTSTSGTAIAPVGIAMFTAGSNATLSFARKGDFVLPAAGAVAAGDFLQSSQSGTNYGYVSVLDNFIGSAASTYDGVHRVIGRAYTAAADGGFAVVRLDL